MKVCILTPEFLPTWGGVGTYTYNLARGLRDLAEVHVLTGTAPRDPDASMDGIWVHSAGPTPGAAAGGSTMRFQLAVRRHLPALVRAEGIDVVHANHAYMSDLLARRRHDAASIVTVHTTLDTQVGGTRRAGNGSPRQPIEERIARWRFALESVERHYLRQTLAMIFVSRWVRERTLREYRVTPRHATVVRNAVDFTEFHPSTEPRGRHPQPRTVLFAGRLLALKGIETLLRAAARVQPEIRLLLAGPGDAAPWRSLAQGLGLGEDRCHFLGQVPYSAMPDLYRSADLVVLPSFSESCPLVALEAMACGTPLIAADAGGVSEIVRDGETGWLFPPGDVDALASRITAVLADPEGTDLLRSRALAWVRENMSIERMATETFRFYEQILEEAAS